jgi:putative spermidine/putrescine transport system ATP-binding protein
MLQVTDRKASPGQQLVLDGITHHYGSGLAVDNITLEIAAGEFVALLGPSGCGKTTLLRIVAGFVAQTQGRVVIGDRVADDMPPNRRDVGIVFQNYALFPHMTAAENVAYGLAARGVSRAGQAERVAEMLGLVQMRHLAERHPKQLSGGQQQRVALARALAVRPRILLLDEPFAALDKNLRLDMQIEVKRIQRVAGTTTILVTHDQDEALSMADRVAVLNQGRLEQFAAPTRIYDRPATRFVNTFVGTANVLAGRIAGTDDAGGTTIALASGATLRVAASDRAFADGAAVIACVRPEHFLLATSGDGLVGTVEMGLQLGATIVHEVRLASGDAVKVAAPRAVGAEPLQPGTAVVLRPAAPTAVNIFPA